MNRTHKIPKRKSLIFPAQLRNLTDIYILFILDEYFYRKLGGTFLQILFYAGANRQQ